MAVSNIVHLFYSIPLMDIMSNFFLFLAMQSVSLKEVRCCAKKPYTRHKNFSSNEAHNSAHCKNYSQYYS